MMTGDSSADCFICRKHRGEVELPGGPIFENDHFYVGHAAVPAGEPTAYLGALVVEPTRHVPGLADLTESEAQLLGLLVHRLSKGLQTSEGAEHIYMFLLGHHAPHLHVWLVPRYPGTPREYWGFRVDEWPDAPRGGPQEIAALCQRIRERLEPQS